MLPSIPARSILNPIKLLSAISPLLVSLPLTTSCLRPCCPSLLAPPPPLSAELPACSPPPLSPHVERRPEPGPVGQPGQVKHSIPPSPLFPFYPPPKAARRLSLSLHQVRTNKAASPLPTLYLARSERTTGHTAGSFRILPPWDCRVSRPPRCNLALRGKKPLPPRAYGQPAKQLSPSPPQSDEQSDRAGLRHLSHRPSVRLTPEARLKRESDQGSAGFVTSRPTPSAITPQKTPNHTNAN